jgi:cytochrome c5
MYKWYIYFSNFAESLININFKNLICMKRLVLIIATVVLSGVLFTSCGGSGSEPKEEKQAPKEEVKQEQQVSQEEGLTADIENGKAVYSKVCIACHMTGVAGAAALTDKERWDEMAAKGMKTLHSSVINGVTEGKYGVMPAKGSCADCSDQDLYDAVSYMLKEAGVTAK